MTLNFRQMEVFRAVMLTGGVSGAAQLLHVSQPAISKMLSQATQQAGFGLFERVKGRLVATPEAHQLQEEIESLWRGLERVRDVAHSLAHPETGTLRLAISASVASHLAPHALTLLYRKFPRLKSRIEVLIPTIMVEALLDRSVHLAVGLQINDHPNLVVVQTYQCGLACVMREDHPLASRRTVRPIDLMGHRIITSPANTAYGQTLLRSYGKFAAQLQLDLEVRSSTTACWHAQAGAGVAVVDAAAVAGVSYPGLAIRRFQTREKLEISIVRNRYLPMSAVQKEFCDAFEAVWKEANQSVG